MAAQEGGHQSKKKGRIQVNKKSDIQELSPVLYALTPFPPAILIR